MSTINRSLYRVVLPMIVLGFSSGIAFSQSRIQVKVDRGKSLKLPERVSASYFKYLESRREHLLERVSGLTFPPSFSSGSDFLNFASVRKVFNSIYSGCEFIFLEFIC